MAEKELNISNAYRCGLKERILDTAIRSFRENGIKAVKMDDIAKRLSISKRTLYEIYANKEDLLFECVRYHDKYFETKLQSQLSKESNVMDILFSFMKLHIEENSMTHPQFFSDLGKYPKVMAYINERNENARGRTNGFMQRGVEEGYFRSDVNHEVISLMTEVFTKHVMDKEIYKRIPINVIMRNVIMVVLRGICTKKGLQFIDQLEF